MTTSLPTATIVRRRDCTADLFQLWLQPSVAFTFRPGQYLTIGANGLERPYSIASAPCEALIELFIEYVPRDEGGHLTPLLHASRIGDRVSIRPTAKGRFVRRAGVSNHVMVATVTGIAPYVSIIRQFLHDRQEHPDADDRSRFFVMQGASYRDEFVYDAELQVLSARHPDRVQFVASVSRPAAGRNAGWTGATGRINVLVEQYLEQWALPKTDTVVYLCGHPGMIEDAESRLNAGGWPVVVERFWLP